MANSKKLYFEEMIPSGVVWRMMNTDTPTDAGDLVIEEGGGVDPTSSLVADVGAGLPSLQTGGIPSASPPEGEQPEILQKMMGRRAENLTDQELKRWIPHVVGRLQPNLGLNQMEIKFS